MRTQSRRILLPGLILLPPALYVLAVLYLAVDIPRWDDYKVFFDYLNRSGEDRLDFLFVPHAEHRIVFTRLVAESMFQLLDRIDFRYLIWIGNLALLLVFWLVLRIFQKTGIPLTFFLPIPYVLFFLALGENTTWATGSIQNHYVLLFAMLSLLCFERKGPLFLLLAMAFAVLAAFTSASGLFVFVVLIPWSILGLLERSGSPDPSDGRDSSNRRLRILRSIAVVAVASVVFYAYFRGYARPPEHPSVWDALLHPLHAAAYFFVFLGSYLQVQVMAFIAGVGSAVLFTRLTLTGYPRRNPVAYFLLAFLVLNALAGTLSRAGFGTDYALSSRYTIVSVLVLILLYTAALETRQGSLSAIGGWRPVAVAVVFLASGLSIALNGGLLVAKRAELIDGIRRWSTSGEGLDYPKQKRAAALLRQASEKGYYQPPRIGRVP